MTTFLSIYLLAGAAMAAVIVSKPGAVNYVNRNVEAETGKPMAWWVPYVGAVLLVLGWPIIALYAFTHGR